MKTDSIKLIKAIPPETAGSLPGLFFRRVTQTPDKTAYRYFEKKSQQWKSITWSDAYYMVSRWQSLFGHFNLKAGDTIAIMLKNSPEWVFAEQAALSLGLVVVPLYINDRAENIAYILNDANVRVMIIDDQQQLIELHSISDHLKNLTALITLIADNRHSAITENKLPLYYYQDVMLKDNCHCQPFKGNADDLATIVYTSGTTGKPKGVMLSHNNILFDTWAAISAVPCQSDDKFLSFLPLSHMFERTAGYYIPMMSGAEVIYARSIDTLAADLQAVKPTVLVTVPRIFERVHQKIMAQVEQKPKLAQLLFQTTIAIGWKRFLVHQGRHKWFPGLLLWPVLNQIIAQKIMLKLGGHLRLAISGGAALNNDIAQFFIALGLTITQGYGMTEAGPVISTNKLDDNDPFSVGQILPGIKIRIGQRGELLIKAKNVMQGYWNNSKATNRILDHSGWLHTGDKAELRNSHLYITGRVKEIIVLSNGEKVPPAELEMAICNDPVFEQVMVVGEAKPYLSAIIVISEDMWPELANAAQINVHEENALANKKLCKLVTNKISRLLSSFPGYEQIRRVKLVLKPWTISNGLLTPTMKLKRNKIISHFKNEINDLYAGHI